MRRRIGQLLRIGVAPQAVALLACHRWRRAELTVLAEQACADASPESIGNALDAALHATGCAGWPAVFVLADSLARFWEVTPPPNATRLADLDAACAFRARTLYGDSMAGWQVAADLDAGQPFLAAAVPRALLDSLLRCAAAHRLKVLEMAPQLVAARNRWHGVLPAGAWFGLVHDGVLTLNAGAQVRTAALPPMADADWLKQQVEREALRLATEPPAHLAVAGEAPASWRLAAGVMLLGPDAGWSSAVRLAATGSAA
jgi:hypothetical protein